MYIALVVIMGIFTITTGGVFISSRNIANLLNQTGYIAVLAIGMTLVIVIRHIDLSVGFLSGFLGAIAAIAMTAWGFPAWAAILAALAMGTLAGLLTGFLVANVGIPAFVASLAGWLIYRGALLLVTLKTGTIIIPSKFFNAIGNGYLPDIFPVDSTFLPDLHKLTLLIGILAIILFNFQSLRDRKNRQTYGFEVPHSDMFVMKLVFISIVLGLITWVIAGYNGMSWTLAIVLVVVMVYHFVTTKTVLGRHIYAVGGNPEAAELSGVSVKKITLIVFGSMGLMCGLSGILFASRLQSATTTAGTLFELDAIAAAYIGGVSAAGGVGKVTGSLIGAIVYMSLTSGMNLMGTDISLQYIIRGAVLVAAVVFDVTTRRAKS
ncbi:MAG: ABC transporter permease [Spirochaetae bacterium HGW-Spirochaetae-3]|jgi:putative multiple sugar transport system permease protein|nr:MAG: ABC transporter permease [Spirochaetae bacterium HGW-Spirochaetae-3]